MLARRRFELLANLFEYVTNAPLAKNELLRQKFSVRESIMTALLPELIKPSNSDGRLELISQYEDFQNILRPTNEEHHKLRNQFIDQIIKDLSPQSDEDEQSDILWSRRREILDKVLYTNILVTLTPAQSAALQQQIEGISQTITRLSLPDGIDAANREATDIVETITYVKLYIDSLQNLFS